mmetsp:Transcript_36044/g.93770  ORF Transcript_36044/g.93770 Transcript_36044/m.93770 type:complete len:155 (-) Transcript_36044:1070-1534(-)
MQSTPFNRRALQGEGAKKYIHQKSILHYNQHKMEQTLFPRKRKCTAHSQTKTVSWRGIGRRHHKTLSRPPHRHFLHTTLVHVDTKHASTYFFFFSLFWNASSTASDVIPFAGEEGLVLKKALGDSGGIPLSSWLDWREAKLKPNPFGEALILGS